jgi:hypothetical protein
VAVFAAGGVRVQVPGSGISAGPVSLPDVRALFCPDPSDWHLWRRRARGESPERCLALAVLTQALLDLERSGAQTWSGTRRLHEETRAWFEATDAEGPHSFVAICELFDWSPDAVRASVLRRHRATPLQLVRRRHP